MKKKKKKEFGNWKSGKRYWHTKTKSTFLGVKHGKWNSTCCSFVFTCIYPVSWKTCKRINLGYFGHQNWGIQTGKAP